MTALLSIVPIGGALVVGRDTEGRGVNLFRPRKGDGFADSVHVVRLVVEQNPGEPDRRYCYRALHEPPRAECLLEAISAMGLDPDEMEFISISPNDKERAFLEWAAVSDGTEGCA